MKSVEKLLLLSVYVGIVILSAIVSAAADTLYVPNSEDIVVSIRENSGPCIPEYCGYYADITVLEGDYVVWYDPVVYLATIYIYIEVYKSDSDGFILYQYLPQNSYYLGQLQPGDYLLIVWAKAPPNLWVPVKTVQFSIPLDSNQYPSISLQSPSNGHSFSSSTTSVTLQWIANDPDGDSLSYDLYLGTSSNPPLYKSGLTSTSYTVSVSPGTTYYWKVVVKDGKGGITSSDIWSFSVRRSYIPTPDQVEIKHFIKGYHSLVNVSIVFSDTCYTITDWGSVIKNGKNFSVDAKIERFSDICLAVLASANHTYDLGVLNNGIYNFTFKVWGNYVKTLSFEIMKFPVASFILYPSFPTVGQTITFDASSSYDPDGQIVSYEWNFGDGSVETTTSPTIQHTYSSAGTYTVTLTVTDNDGLTASTSKQITIQEVNQKQQLKEEILQLILQYLQTQDTQQKQQIKQLILQKILQYLLMG